jgi:hypothetical protein
MVLRGRRLRERSPKDLRMFGYTVCYIKQSWSRLWRRKPLLHQHRLHLMYISMRQEHRQQEEPLPLSQSQPLLLQRPNRVSAPAWDRTPA